MNQIDHSNSTDHLINPDGSSVSLSPGPFEGWGNDGKQPFMIEVDAKPLASLVQDARNGVRVYEFMTINRPGVIYSYLRVKAIEVTRWVDKNIQAIEPRHDDEARDLAEGFVPLDLFDDLFHWQGDDTRPESKCWLEFREKEHWKQSAIQLLAWVKAQQSLLRAASNPLVIREIGYIDRQIHRRDFVPVIERRCLSKPVNMHTVRIDLPDAAIDAVANLFKHAEVLSVSAPFDNFKLWELLCNEQLIRAEITGGAARKELPLFGPDFGLERIPYEDWGADVHIPFSGICMADLFIKPHCCASFPERDKSDGKLVSVFGSTLSHFTSGDSCRYVITPNDLGELKCAKRRELGEGWVLYQSRNA